MKTFIVNSVKGVVEEKKKFDVSSKLVGREWKMLSDEPAVSCKYIFLKDGKLVLSVNGMSTYSTWQMATPTSIIMDEGVGTFLYKIVHLDEDIIVLNLDGTDNYCFLINDASSKIANTSFENFKWFLLTRCNIDMLSLEEKKDNQRRYEGIVRENNDKRLQEKDESDNEMVLSWIVFAIIILIVAVIIAQSA